MYQLSGQGKTKMRYWIGVVGSRNTVERLRTEGETWWCAPKDAAAGDLFALYVARSKLKDLPENQGGIVAIFEIVGAAPEQELECRRYGGGSSGQALAPVQILMKEKFSVSLKLAEMKLDGQLRAAKFVKRSMQGTCFEATVQEFQRIRTLLAAMQIQP